MRRPPTARCCPPARPQTFGLTLTSATRASFLIQATALLTPLLATLAGDRPGPRIWAGCTLALGGTLLIAADKAAGGGGGGGAEAAAGLHLGERQRPSSCSRAVRAKRQGAVWRAR